MIETGESETIFQKAITDQGRGQVGGFAVGVEPLPRLALGLPSFSASHLRRLSGLSV